MAVRWILESPRARAELRMVEPIVAIMAALRLLDASYEGMVEQQPDIANAVADLVDDFHERVAVIRETLP